MREKVWFVSGASTGFGRAIVDVALAAGDFVVATARRPEAFVGAFGDAADRALALPLDVTDDLEIRAAVDAALGRFGRIDVLVNNAGYGLVGALEETADDELRAQLETNFFGAVSLTRAVLPSMRAAGSGAIVQISSMGGQLSAPGFGAYCASKWALEAMSEALAAEVAPLGIAVLIVEPGAFRTEFAGASLRRMPEIDAYRESVGGTRSFADGMHGAQAGDPVKAARAIRLALESSPRPLRLVLGGDAVDGIRARLRTTLDEIDAWERVARETSIDDA